MWPGDLEMTRWEKTGWFVNLNGKRRTVVVVEGGETGIFETMGVFWEKAWGKREKRLVLGGLPIRTAIEKGFHNLERLEIRVKSELGETIAGKWTRCRHRAT